MNDYSFSLVIHPEYKLKWIDEHWTAEERKEAERVVKESVRFHLLCYSL